MKEGELFSRTKINCQGLIRCNSHAYDQNNLPLAIQHFLTRIRQIGKMSSWTGCFSDSVGYSQNLLFNKTFISTKREDASSSALGTSWIPADSCWCSPFAAFATSLDLGFVSDSHISPAVHIPGKLEKRVALSEVFPIRLEIPGICCAPPPVVGPIPPMKGESSP